MAKPMYYKDWDEMPPVLDLAECAIILNITYDTARKWAKKGRLPAIQIGGTEWRVEKTALKNMFEAPTPPSKSLTRNEFANVQGDEKNVDVLAQIFTEIKTINEKLARIGS